MALGTEKHGRPLSPISRRAFLAAGPVAVGAGLAVGAGVAGCGGGYGYTYADYADYADASCGYCNTGGTNYYHCDGLYCNYFNA